MNSLRQKKVMPAIGGSVAWILALAQWGRRRPDGGRPGTAERERAAFAMLDFQSV